MFIIFVAFTVVHGENSWERVFEAEYNGELIHTGYSGGRLDSYPTFADIDNAEKADLEWGVKNDDGNEISSGVYFYRVSNDNGEEKIGKVAVIR